MARKDSHRKQTPISGGVIKRNLDEGLESGEQVKGIPEREEAKVFVASVLTKPNEEAVRTSKVPLSKRKVSSGKGPKRKPKKPKTSKISEAVEGVEEASVNEPGGRLEESTSDQGVKMCLKLSRSQCQRKPKKSPSILLLVQCVWYPGRPPHERPPSPRLSLDTQTSFMPIGSEEG
ncbi:hypothetical protein LIER_35778 [Lithospermum erythrorhizon]|uniref:Uncharacterized protein n=1 Tax=Lithospermum erythrorhizon TaxID=34254 RepID=A0AAV3NW78_LITER